MMSKKVLFYSFVFFCVAVGLGKIIFLLPSRTHENDFAHYYASSRALIEHYDVYRVNLHDAYERYQFTYSYRTPHPTNPPLLLWIFAPFALMPPISAFWAWVFIQSVCTLAIMWMVKRVLAEHSSKSIWPLSCAAFLLSFPVCYNFTYSQIQLPLLALILGAYLLHKQNRPLIALTLAVIAGMIKLYPLVFVPWFIWRGTTTARKRVMYGLYTLFLICAIIFVTGVDLWTDFLTNGIPIISSAAINARGNYSLPSFIVNIGYSLYGLVPPAGAKNTLMTIGGIAGMGVIIMVYTSFFRMKRNDDSEFALLCIAAIFGGITGWSYYLVFLLFPFSLAFSTLRLDTPWKRIPLMFILAISITAGAETELSISRHGSFYAHQLLLFYLPMFAMIVLGGLLLAESRRSIRT